MIAARLATLTAAYEHAELLLCYAIVDGVTAHIKKLRYILNDLEKAIYDNLALLSDD